MSFVPKVVSVNVGQAQVILAGGKSVRSAIRKSAVKGAIAVNVLGLVGDEQVSLSVHGGREMAVYLYPADHYDYWRQAYPNLALPYGALGENLTIHGVREDSIFVGDVLHFPQCVLGVTKPREPCSKFNAVLGDDLAAKKMKHNGRCGFYASVLESGLISAGESFTIAPGPRLISIAQAFS